MHYPGLEATRAVDAYLREEVGLIPVFPTLPADIYYPVGENFAHLQARAEFASSHPVRSSARSIICGCRIDLRADLFQMAAAY